MRKIPREARLRSLHLLDMLYTPGELAAELEINPRDIYQRLIPDGLPHSRDAEGHIWLHGPMVAHWFKQAAKPVRNPLGAHEAYCLKCRLAVEMIEPRRIRRGRFVLLQSTCPTCGRTVNRGVKTK